MQLDIAARQRGVFLDTSALYAELDLRDQWHQRAVAGFRRLLEQGRVLFVTDLVVAETYRLCLQRLGGEAAEAWLGVLNRFNVLFLNYERHLRTVALLHSDRARRLTYTDASSFATMRDFGIPIAFSFDRHFVEQGFTPFDP